MERPEGTAQGITREDSGFSEEVDETELWRLMGYTVKAWREK